MVKILSAVLGVLAASLFPAALLNAQSPGGAPTPENYVLIHAGKLLAVPGRAPESQMTIVVRNDRVLRIEKGFLSATAAGAPAGATVAVIDLSGRFVLPGLMDAHVHLRDQPSFSRRRAERGDRKELTGAEGAVNAMIYARRNLAAGFTSLRDVGSDDQSVFAVRNAINSGRMIGPRILVAGHGISVTAGHADDLPMELTADARARLYSGICDGPAECREAVRFEYKLGADLIKMMATGGFGSNTGLDQEIHFDEMEAIVSTAHMRGLKVAVHAYAANAIKDALRAGVDSIEHGFLLDDEGIRMMKKQGTWLVPTLSASYPPPIFKIPNPESVRLRNEYKAFERAYAAGVKIAFGTDSGTFTHGQNAKEFDLMVGFGMAPKDAIYAATVSTAQLFGIDAEAGTLEAGKLADIIAVDGDPLTDIKALHQIDFVMKSGKVAKQAGQMTEPFTYLPFGTP